MAHIIDSEFYKNGWGTKEMRDVFDDRKRYQRWLDIEVALANAQANLGIIPKYAAKEISKNAKLELLDLENIKRDLKKTGHSLVPLLKEVQSVCNGDAGEYIHYGPTTQDIEDTGVALEIKDAYKIILRDLYAIEKKIIDLAEKYKNLPMAGRTHNQQGLPITLGLKFATWAAEIRRDIERMKDIKKRIFVGMLHGGTGTMAGLGEKAFETIDLVMQDLGLEVPEIGWGSSRDYFTEYILVTGMVGATFGKIANEIYQLSRTEIGELQEPLTKGYIGSSTMPHKRNAETSEFVVAISRIVINNCSLALQSMISEHERDTRSWRLDWHTIPENSILVAKILEDCKYVLGGLDINTKKISENLNLLKGMLFSEAIMLYLGKKVGKQTAHQLIHDAIINAKDKDISFKNILLNHKEIQKYITEEELNNIMDYNKHIGKSVNLVKKVIEKSRLLAKNDNEYLKF